MQEVGSEPYMALGLGSLGLIGAVLFRLGYYRSQARWYWDDGAPFYLRHLAFGQGPISVSFLCAFAYLIGLKRSGDPASGIGWVLVSMILLGVGFVFMMRPPRVMKPSWLIAEERDRSSAANPRGVWRAMDVASAVFLMACVLVGAGAALYGLLSTRAP